MIKQIRNDNLRDGCQPLAEQMTPTPETCIFADKSTGSPALAPAIAMPEWLQTMETNHLGISMPGDEAKLRFAIQLAAENVRQGTGGPFGAAIFELQTDKIGCGRGESGDVGATIVGACRDDRLQQRPTALKAFAVKEVYARHEL